MDFPIVCPECRAVNMVDFDNLAKRPLTRTNWEYGFSCECGRWSTVMVSNRLADAELRTLETRKIDRKFPYHFSKVLKRMMALRGAV